MRESSSKRCPLDEFGLFFHIPRPPSLSSDNMGSQLTIKSETSTKGFEYKVKDMSMADFGCAFPRCAHSAAAMAPCARGCPPRQSVACGRLRTGRTLDDIASNPSSPHPGASMTMPPDPLPGSTRGGPPVLRRGTKQPLTHSHASLSIHGVQTASPREGRGAPYACQRAGLSAAGPPPWPVLGASFTVIAWRCV